MDDDLQARLAASLERARVIVFRMSCRRVYVPRTHDLPPSRWPTYPRDWGKRFLYGWRPFERAPDPAPLVSADVPPIVHTSSLVRISFASRHPSRQLRLDLGGV